jgi:hypothetical protein
MFMKYTKVIFGEQYQFDTQIVKNTIVTPVITPPITVIVPVYDFIVRIKLTPQFKIEVQHLID